MVTPVIAQNFHQFSLVGVVTNVFILWTVSFIMILGGLMLLVGFLANSLAWLISQGVLVFLTYFIYIVQFFASLSFAWQYVGEQMWIVWVGYYLIITGILLALNKNNLKSKKF